MPRSSSHIALIIIAGITWIQPVNAQVRARGRPPGLETRQAIPDTTLIEGKIQYLEQRLRQLEALMTAQQEETRRASLRQRGQQQARGQGAAGQRESSPVRFQSAQRQMNQLNPEISMGGDFMGWIRSPETVRDRDGTPLEPAFAAGNRFWFREAELSIIAPLDPYTRGKFFFGIPSDGGELAIEEAYMQWINLPTGLNLKIGFFRNQFGQLNRWHDHALPQADRPHVLQTFLGGEGGLAGLGGSFNWTLPGLWSHVNDLTVEFISGGDGISYADNFSRNRILLGRLKNYWDLSANTYLELGVSGSYGHNDSARQYTTRLGGIDLNYRWIPAGRGHYRSLEVRAEAIGSWRETLAGDVQAWGGYLSIQNRLNARFLTSLRVDYTQLPENADHDLKAIGATLDYWQSEFVVFRIQIDRIQRSFAATENRLIFQAIWAMGPHKHEAY